MNKNYKKIGIIFELVFLTVVLSNPFITSYRAQIDQGITPPPDSGRPPTLIQCVRPGDIIFFDHASSEGILTDLFYTIENFPNEGINSNDHCTLFVGNNPDDPNHYTDWCIHNGDPTSYKELSEFQKTNTNFTAFRVKGASSEQITRVIEWVKDRVSQECEYQLKPWILSYYMLVLKTDFWGALTYIMRKDCNNVQIKDTLLNKYLENKFYCDELIWAAYYNVTRIDIDNNGFSSYPYGVPTVNMGIVVAYDQHYRDTLSSDAYNYAKLNEIKIDNDVYQVYPVSAQPGIALATND